MAFVLNFWILDIAFEFKILNNVLQFSLLHILKVFLLCLEHGSELLLVLVELFATNFEPIHHMCCVKLLINGSLSLYFVQ